MGETVSMKTARLLALPLALALAACTGFRVSTDHDPRADFARLQSYAWIPRPKPADPLVANTLVTNRVHDAIDRELERKGFRRADAAKPDFLVDFACTGRGRLDVVAWPSWGSWRRWGWTDVQAIEYVEGTMIVGVLDPTTHDVLWRGAATRALDEDSGGVEQVDEVVKAVLAGFPPR